MSRRRTAVVELLRDLAGAMNARGLQWYLFGAQAAIVWGSPRLSADVDVTAAISPEMLTEYIDTMKSHGFDLVVGDSDFVARTRVLPFVHRPSRMLLDVVLGGPGLEDDFLRRAIRVDIGGTAISVITPEDLIITKTLAGRPKDIEDMRNVIHGRRASLDVGRIRDILGLLERALGQSDLVPLFEKIWDEQDKGVKKVAPAKRTKRTQKKK